MHMLSPHLLPAGALIEVYNPPSNPDQSEDGLSQLDTAEYYRARCKVNRGIELARAIQAKQAELEALKMELWKLENPNDPLTWLLG